MNQLLPRLFVTGILTLVVWLTVSAVIRIPDDSDRLMTLVGPPHPALRSLDIAYRQPVVA